MRQNVILTDGTPTIMLNREGVKDLPLSMKASHIRENILSEKKAKSIGLRTGEGIHYHDLGEDLFYKVIDGLNDVTEAYRGTKNAENPQRRENYFLLVSKVKDKNGDIINVPIYFNTTSLYNNVYIDTNSVATVYGKQKIRDYINNQIKFGNLVRIKRSTTASERTGLIPDNYSSNASTNIISNPNKKSNTFDENNSNGMEQSRDADYISAVQRGDMKTAAVGMLRKVKNPIENSRRIWYDRSINYNRQTSRRSSS